MPSKNVPAVLPATPFGAGESVTTQVLDAQMYPHIIDAIFSHADARDLLRLRTTCLSWYVRANDVLSSHIILFALAPPTAAVNGALVRHPAYHQFDWARAPRLKPAKTLPRVLDFLRLRDDTLRSDLRWLKKSVPFARTWENGMRDLDIGEPYTSSHTVVIFCWPEGPLVDRGSCICSRCLNLYEHNDNEPDHCDCPHCRLDEVCQSQKYGFYDTYSLPTPIWAGEGTRKVVVNIATTSKTPNAPDAGICTFDTIFIQSLEEVVLNVVAPAGPEEDGTADRFIESLYAMNECPRIKYTVVNSSALPRQRLARSPYFGGMPKSRAAFQSEKPLRDCVTILFKEAREIQWAELGLDEYDGHDDRSPPDVEFLSSQEYEARVGNERYRIETMEQPW